MNLPLNSIIQGDALEVLKTLPDECVDCIITSPPYWSLRDYGEETKTIWGGDRNCEHNWIEEITPRPNASGGKTEWAREKLGIKGKENYQEFVDYEKRETKSDFCSKCGAWYGQLGLEPTLEMYLEHMLQITAELKKVLKKTGTMWWNHGDSYASRGNEQSRWAGDGKLSKAEHGRARISDYPEKSLLLQNFRFAQRMIDEQQWVLRNILIWWKPNCMPSSAKDRFTVDFEPVFFFTKSKKYWFEQQFERRETEPQKDLERIRNQQRSRNKHAQGGVMSYRNTLTDESIMQRAKLGRTKRCVWKIPTHPFSGAHFATFPPALIEPMIKAGCPPNGIVLDPFMGSGTTAVVAKNLGRNYIGIELNPDYIKIAERRIKEEVPEKLL